ncbi:hypothetical protein EDB19DRAFT_1322289 [Suillus lakei]|nr:hypothetical protein EDB19DRAFT_1322289 [Suillus lakei]
MTSARDAAHSVRNNLSTIGTSLLVITGCLNRGRMPLRERRKKIFLNTHVTVVVMIVMTMVFLHWIMLRKGVQTIQKIPSGPRATPMCSHCPPASMPQTAKDRINPFRSLCIRNVHDSCRITFRISLPPRPDTEPRRPRSTRPRHDSTPWAPSGSRSNQPFEDTSFPRDHLDRPSNNRGGSSLIDQVGCRWRPVILFIKRSREGPYEAAFG